MINRRTWLVSLSRGQEESRVFTDCPELLEQCVVRPEERESALSLASGSQPAPAIEQARREVDLQEGKREKSPRNYELGKDAAHPEKTAAIEWEACERRLRSTLAQHHPELTGEALEAHIAATVPQILAAQARQAAEVQRIRRAVDRDHHQDHGQSKTHEQSRDQEMER